MNKHQNLTIVPGATANGEFLTSGTNPMPARGWVEKVAFTSVNWANGSIFLIDATTKEIIFGAGAISGTNPVVVYPRRYPETNGGVSLSGTSYQVERYYVQSYVIASGLGLGSSTAGTTGSIAIFYYD